MIFVYEAVAGELLGYFRFSSFKPRTINIATAEQPLVPQFLTRLIGQLNQPMRTRVSQLSSELRNSSRQHGSTLEATTRCNFSYNHHHSSSNPRAAGTDCLRCCSPGYCCGRRSRYATPSLYGLSALEHMPRLSKNQSRLNLSRPSHLPRSRQLLRPPRLSSTAMPASQCARTHPGLRVCVI